MKRLWCLIGLMLLTALLSNCGQAEKSADLKLSEAHQRLIKICKEEYNLDIIVRPLKDTLWIYLPAKEPFLDLKATEPSKTPEPQPAVTESKTINFLDGKFSGRTFSLSFDIGNAKKYAAADPGYSYTSPEQFQKNLQNLPTAINRVLNETAPAEQPKFIIVIFADIVKGLEYQMSMYWPDLMRGNIDPSFSEEYRRRIIMEGPRGNPAIISDTTGTHLQVTELAWTDFLVKQILYRIRFKYQQSSIPPKPDDNEEILRQVAATLLAYPFQEFDNVKLIDLGNDKTLDFRKEQLKTFAE